MLTITLTPQISLTVITSGIAVRVANANDSHKVHTACISPLVLIDMLDELQKLHTSGGYAAKPDSCIGSGIDGE